DGSLLAYGAGTSVLLWDARHGKLLHKYTPQELKDKDEGVWSLCLSRDGSRLAASWRNRVSLWDTASHEAVKGFASSEDFAFLRFRADGAELVGVSAFLRRVRRWSATTGKELGSSSSSEDQHWFWRSALSPDGRTIAGIRNGRAAIVLYDAASWKELV